MEERHHFFIFPDSIKGNRFFLNGDEGHHLARVARVDMGDEIFLLDSKGRAYQAVVEKIIGTRIEGSIQDRIENYHEPTVNLHLGIGLLKGSKLDVVAEKGTELGVYSLTPLIMARSVKKSINMARLKKVVQAAAKQCGRGHIPSISEPVPLTEWCLELDSHHSVAMHSSQSSVPVSEWLGHCDNHVSEIWMIVGPEGGFDYEELELISDLDISTVSLGPRRLRSETAAISALVLFDNHFAARGYYD